MPRRPSVSDITSLSVPETPSLSPDGTRVAYALRRSTCGDATDTADAADRTERALWWAAADGSGARALTRGPDDRSPAWSPDGDRIAFLRAAGGPPQIWVLPVDGGEPEPVTDLPLGAGAPVWSPDGTRIACTAPVDTAPGAPGRPLVTARLDYQADGAGLLGTVRAHVHVTDPATGATRPVTEGPRSASAPAWSPDGARLVFTAATGDDADLTRCSAPYVLDLASGAAPQRIGAADGYVSAASWTPDGTALLAVAGQGGPFGSVRLVRLPLDGAPEDLSGALDRNVMPGAPGYPGAPPQTTPDGTILFCVRDDGDTHVYAVTPGASPRPVVTGAGRTVTGMSAARDTDTTALVLGTPTSYGEIVTVAAGAETVCTDHGAGLAEPFVREPRTFAISDGTTVHGWLVRDPGAAGPLPLLLDIHGGPHNAWSGAADEHHLYQQELAAHGWAVLLVNPRGSDGYGADFFGAVRGGWGTGDAADFLEPLDALVAEGLADPRRLAVAGYSYGGFMTCYLTGRDRRFAAAVAGGVVSDLPSMAGASDAGHDLAVHELRGLPWTDPGHLAEMSPYARVDAVTTPTLVLHGADDLRCPADQAKLWHSALRVRGVPSELVLYPGASHLFVLSGRPSQRRDFGRRLVDWVQRYAGTPGTVRPAPIDAAHWERRLATLAARHAVPGASLGILRLGADGAPDELAEAAYGVTSTATGVPVTTDTVFQIGSITKVWTATVAMRLVDDGKLTLDTPVAEVLPELRLADDAVAARVTVRHLLTHTSGIDGDLFTDTGRGDDCVERYVDVLRDAAQTHPLGATWSYCNAGFVLLGRVIEKITGATWDAAIRDHLRTPLGLEHTVTLPEEALLHRAAVGHIGEAGADPAPAPIWQLPRAVGPAGLVTATAADVLGFARMHLTDGLAPDGTRVLSAKSAAAMRDERTEVPDPYTLGDSWGLGWIRFGWDGRRLVGHDGNTIGQSAFLRVLPSHGLAVVLLTNGGHTRDLFQDLYREIFADLAGVAVPEPLAPPRDPPATDLTPHEGTYERASSRIDVFTDDGTPTIRITATGPLAALTPEPSQTLTLVPADATGDLYCVREPGVQTWMPVTFYDLPTGEHYVHVGARATPKRTG
ncbi:MAG TPA: serine hydrolase [Streptosporangiaceae bacterium]|jgi:dipeptidyl aminopeptidase/acylaminoacyl peptidase